MANEDYTAKNRERLISFFESGTKKATELGNLGVEVEHFVVAQDGTPISYEPTDANVGIRDVLDHLSAWYPHKTFNSRHDLLGLLGEEGSITLEPAAQLELSAAPYKRIADVKGAYERFRNRVDSFLEARGARIRTGGYHPTRRAQEMTLIPKERYAYMDSYFARIGTHGDRMMRASASTQVSVDYVNEADAVRKMRVAAALAPILAAICDNTRTYEGKDNNMPIRRLTLWREVDGLRCGTIPHIFEEGFGFGAYADWLLGVPPIFVTRPASDDPHGARIRPFFVQPAAEAYSDSPMDDADVEHLISMFWPDVRLKRFVEIRPADCVPQEQVLGYTALIKGIFYSEESLSAVEEELGVDAQTRATHGAWGITNEDVTNAIAQIQERGLSAEVYGKHILSWERQLFSLAYRALPPNERVYLAPLESFAADKPWWKSERGNS